MWHCGEEVEVPCNDIVNNDWVCNGKCKCGLLRGFLLVV